MDKDKFFVTYEETCPECEGAGRFYNPRYAEMEQHFEALGTMPTQEMEDDYWREQGFDEPPHEEPPCENCFRTGRIRTQVPVEEALRAFGLIH